MYWKSTFQTPVGPLSLLHEEGALCVAAWESNADTLLAELEPAESVEPSAVPLVAETHAQLSAYFDGRLERFELPINPRGTPFQRRVWQILQEVRYGTTTSYQSLAELLGLNGGARAVGAANGKNPISIVIPCHRVIGRTGKLTGYAGGMRAKQFLLELELGWHRGVRGVSH